jgi:hypothetical protein
MFKKSGNDTLVDQGKSLASDISDAIAPHVERAREEVGPRLAEAKDAIAPKLAEAREQAVPLVESARDKLVNEVIPAVKVAVADAAEQAAPVVEEAKKRGSSAVDALKGEDLQPKKKGRKRKFFLFAALAGAGAYVFSKVRGKDDSNNWQSSYTPSPSPAAPPSPASPAAPMGGSHAADTSGDTPPAGDSAGASPGESIADATEEPHPVTTPDSPAEEVEVTDEADAAGTAGAAKKAARKKA